MLYPLRTLSTLNADKKPDFGSANIFGDRISAFIRNGKTYETILTNLKYNDTNSFQLEVGIRRVDSSRKKRGIINLLVEGMVNVICFSCS